MKITRTIFKLIFGYDWEVVEVQGAMFKIAWGVWMLLPFPMFKTFEGYTAYGTENFYGLSLLIMGIVHLTAIASHKVDIRRRITFLAFLFWFFSIIMVYTQSKFSALIPLFAVVAFFMGVNFIRLSRIIRERDKDQ